MSENPSRKRPEWKWTAGVFNCHPRWHQKATCSPKQCERVNECRDYKRQKESLPWGSRLFLCDSLSLLWLIIVYCFSNIICKKETLSSLGVKWTSALIFWLNRYLAVTFIVHSYVFPLANCVSIMVILGCWGVVTLALMMGNGCHFTYRLIYHSMFLLARKDGNDWHFQRSHTQHIKCVQGNTNIHE